MWGWTEWIYFIFGFIAIVVATIVIIKYNKSLRKNDVTANSPIVENDYRKEFTEGYTLGVLKSIKKCKNGCTRIEMYPIDIEQGEEIARPSIQTFIVKNEYIKFFGIGELSDYRQRIKTITRNPFLIPEKMRRTLEADYITKKGQLGWLKAEVGKMIPAGDEAIAEIMKNYARGNMTKAEIARQKEINQKYNELKITSPESTGEPKPIK